MKPKSIYNIKNNRLYREQLLIVFNTFRYSKCCNIFGDEILQLIFTIFGGMIMEEQYEDFYNPYEDVDFLRKSKKEEKMIN